MFSENITAKCYWDMRKRYVLVSLENEVFLDCGDQG